MNTISAALKAHYQSRDRTLATCLWIKRRDNTVYGFTGCDIDLAYDRVDYLTVGSYVHSATSHTSSMSVDNSEIEIALTSAGADRDDIQAGLFDYAAFRIFEVNYKDLTMGHNPIQCGNFGELSISANRAKIELRSLSQKLQQNIGRIYEAGCDAVLGDTRCGVNLAAYTVTGTVTSVGSNKTFTDTSRTEADDYFTNGLLTWTSGNNSGRQMEVRGYTAAKVFTLFEKMAGDIQVGDGYSVSAGCLGDFDACKDKFSNGYRFRGKPTMPGQDEIMQVGRP